MEVYIELDNLASRREYLRAVADHASDIRKGILKLTTAFCIPRQYEEHKFEIRALNHEWNHAASSIRRLATLPTADQRPDSLSDKWAAYRMAHFPNAHIVRKWQPVADLHHRTKNLILEEHQPLELSILRDLLVVDTGITIQTIEQLAQQTLQSIIATYHPPQ